MRWCRGLILSGVVLTAMPAAVAQAQGLFDASKYGIEWQSGLRYWHSTGKHSFNLSDSTGQPLISRLTWDKVEAQAAETFFRADHWRGIFLKGHLGSGSLNNGNLKDQDFSPFVSLDSSTDSQQRDGHIRYGTLDLGYTFLKRATYRIGAFGGYTVWRDRMNAFGCQQTGANTGICVPTIPTSSLGLTEALEWRAWRAGISADFKLSDRLSLTAEGAYLSSELLGTDRHHFRTDLPNATPLDATSNGVQLEAVLTYALDHAFSIGVGGRYWHMAEGSGHARFDSNGGMPQVARFESERFGAFMQGSYKLGATPERGSMKDAHGRAQLPYRWTGFYGGAHIGTGSGAGDDTTRFAGDSALFGPGISGGFIPAKVTTETSGMLGGLQTGYNLRLSQKLVGGIEADISWARIVGTSTYVDPVTAGEFSTTIEQRINWLGTLRGRLGFLVTPSLLLYGTGGLAVGDTSLDLSANDPACRYYLGCARNASSGSVHYGWTVGGGYEYAISTAMTWRTEYQYVNLGSQSVTVSDSSGPAGNFYKGDTDIALHTVRSGFNFKF